MRSWSCFVMVLLAGIASAQQSLVQAQGQVLYFSGSSTGSGDGDVAPGMAAAEKFGGSSQDSAVVDDDGRAFFRARLVSNTGTTLSPAYLQYAYFYGDSKGNLVKVLRGGDPDPSGTIPNAILTTSANGVPFTSSPRISGNGVVMFGASVWDFVGSTITTANDTVLYVGTPGSFQVLAREGDVAPGAGGATYSQSFSGMSQQPTCINGAGVALFQSTLAGATAVPPVVTANNAAWFSGTAGAVQMILRKGDLLANNEQISALGSLSQMNSVGQFVTDVTLLLGSGNVPVTNSDDRALLVYTPGIGIQELAREGGATPIPGTFYGSASNFTSIYGTGSSSFNINGELLNNVLLSGAVTTGVDDRALIIQSLTGGSVVFRRGDLAPGVQGANPGAVLDVANDASCALNDNGQVAFQATMTGGGVTAANDSGIWIGTPNNLTLVVREGDVAPGTGGLTFGQTTGVTLLMNAAGQLYFSNSLSGGSGSSWMWDPVVGVQPVFLPGGQIEVQPGIFRTPYTAGTIQFSNGDSRPLSLANDGTVVVKLSMTDGTSYGSQALVSVRVGSLTGIAKKISATTGGTQHLYLNAGAAHSGQVYVVAGSASGTAPGTPIGALLVPLNIDFYTDFTLQNANVGPFVDTFSTLDADGRGHAQIVIPPGLVGLAGIVVHHAYGVIDIGGNLVFASEAQSLELIP